jgi:hypothetical protein
LFISYCWCLLVLQSFCYICNSCNKAPIPWKIVWKPLVKRHIRDTFIRPFRVSENIKSFHVWVNVKKNEASFFQDRWKPVKLSVYYMRDTYYTCIIAEKNALCTSELCIWNCFSLLMFIRHNETFVYLKIIY